MVGGPWAWPGAGGATQLTGLTYNPFIARVVAVDTASNRFKGDGGLSAAREAWPAQLDTPSGDGYSNVFAIGSKSRAKNDFRTIGQLGCRTGR